jgi:hypothetical protein
MAYTEIPSRRRTSPGRPNSVRRLPKPDRRRALELLADCPQEGCTEAIMLAHGFTIEQLVELVRARLATATPQRVRAGRTAMEVATLRITDAGRKVLPSYQP